MMGYSKIKRLFSKRDLNEIEKEKEPDEKCFPFYT